MRALILVAALLASSTAYGQDTPVAATCKDGSAWSGARRAGACRGHGGVQTFSATASPATVPTGVPNPIAPVTPSPPAREAAAPGGAAGQVWVNTATKVYHCAGDRFYGTTKQGSYMTENAARAAGDRPSRGKGCTA